MGSCLGMPDGRHAIGYHECACTEGKEEKTRRQPRCSDIDVSEWFPHGCSNLQNKIRGRLLLNKSVGVDFEPQCGT